MKRAPIVGGKYVLARLLGKGAMGAVYEAVEMETGVRAAVKVMRRPVEPDEQQGLIARFEREAHAIRRIVSEHVPRIMEAGIDRDTGFHYIAMELFRGESLDQLSRRMDGVSATLAKKIAAQTCAGLAAAHATGVIHRDVKPGNLFLAARDGLAVVKILDFGVAKLRMDGLWDKFEDVTELGKMPGSPRYMSPEQTRGEAAADARADIWSLGIVMYELLAGTTPFGEQPSLGDLITAISSAEPVPIRRRIRWVPADYERIVTRALQTDLHRRYQSAAEMLADLDAALPDGRTITPDLMISPAEMPTSVIQIPAVMRARQPSLPSIFETTTTGVEALTEEQISEIEIRQEVWARKQTDAQAPPGLDDFPTELMNLSDFPEEILKNAADILAPAGSPEPAPGPAAQPLAASHEFSVDLAELDQSRTSEPCGPADRRLEPEPPRPSRALRWIAFVLVALAAAAACAWALR